MDFEKNTLLIRPLEAVFITILLMGALGYLIIGVEVVPHIAIMTGIALLLVYGAIKKVSFRDLEQAMVEGVKPGLGAIMIFFFIGMLISSWMASGTIPTFIFLAVELVSGKFYFAIVFVVTAIIGICIGSSLTTAATIGVGFIGASTALDISPAITAGAVISGAFFGDKMSPLSDTTTLAASVADTDLFEHIKDMAWTTVPAFIISFLVYLLISPGKTGDSIQKIDEIKDTLLNLNLVHWYSLIPLILLAILALKKVSVIATLFAGTISALIISFWVNNGLGFHAILDLLYSGYKSTSGIAEVDSMLSRGGIESMMFSISIILLALSMGGLLFRLGIVPALLSVVQNMLHRVSLLVCSAAGTAIAVNFILGEQYLSILLPGNAFKENFKKAGLQPKHLSRVLEDAGTVVNPLVPWGVCGVFLSSVLGVSVADYALFALFCLLCPLITIFYGFTGISLSNSKKQ
ncbi:MULTISPECIES: Na+/H+ antiporter NhaC [Bacillaceae]|uniref:Na+/H+ antiporter NhaC n=1 Tax=Bacillaceae TaxID=186817 RepID=UPI001E28FD96|nr:MULTISPECIES: Na+/H+ antiporter NhaC [Bacillaceae]MCE4051478.1 Na+/H+ antiporter NhaC [Bacillus sp. Au-Bac7]MCM3031743.1 Na+/H+ antiporter NhaC [Niallia sp. MER 6]UPO89745.1 Na+/H+ antiporter NhaC [Niallia sp. Man26]